MTQATPDASQAQSDSALESWLAEVGRTGEAPGYSPVYRMKLAGSDSTTLKAYPKDQTPGDAIRGHEISEGRWKFGGASIEVPRGHSPWGPPFPTPHFADRIHRFDWLRDLSLLGGQGEACGRSLAVAWVDRYGNWEPFAWRLSVTADRIINWLCAGPWLIGGLVGKAREDLLDSIGRQARHLHASGEDEPDPASRFRVAVALSMAGAAMNAESLREDGLALLEKECAHQLLADGGHASRSPEMLAKALIDLATVEEILLRVGQDAPPFLRRLQPRMAAMLKFFMLPDGALVPANGGGEGLRGLASAAVAPFGDVVSRFTFARLTGFQRVTAEQLSLFMDVGMGPENGQGGHAHAGTLGICIADGAETLITSCAGNPDLDPQLKSAARQSAAHSVLTLSGRSSAVFTPSERSGLDEVKGPPGLSARRLEEDNQFLLEGQHDAWRDEFGVLYRRRLYIARDGDRITGEDSLSRPISSESGGEVFEIPYELRFHLHPDVQIAPGEDDRTVYLGLPSSQNVWRFKSEALLSIEDSRYWGRRESRVTSQIVVRGTASSVGDGSTPPNRIRWALLRVEAGATNLA